MRDAKTRSVLVIDFKIPIYVVPIWLCQYCYSAWWTDQKSTSLKMANDDSIGNCPVKLMPR
jgi:hypothetical protein